MNNVGQDFFQHAGVYLFLPLQIGLSQFLKQILQQLYHFNIKLNFSKGAMNEEEEK